MPRKSPRVLSFDPGYERLGVAILEKNPPAGGGKDVLLYSGCIRTQATLPFPERLHILGAAAEAAIVKWKPTAVALENVFFEKNAKTAMGVARVAGMLSYIAASKGLPVFEYTPLEVKVAMTGYGKSDKRSVAAMVARLVHVPVRKRLDDELDAIAIGLTCLASAKLL